MAIRDLIPWGRHHGPHGDASYRDHGRHPFLALRREVNRLFDDAFHNFDFPGFGRLPAWSQIGYSHWPSVEINATDKDFVVVADVPGLEEKDIEILLEGEELTLRGEKRPETEDKDRQFSERFYGRFERRIPLGPGIDEDKVNASFRNGVLTITLPKSVAAQSRARRINIEGGG